MVIFRVMRGGCGHGGSCGSWCWFSIVLRETFTPPLFTPLCSHLRRVGCSSKREPPPYRVRWEHRRGRRDGVRRPEGAGRSLTRGLSWRGETASLGRPGDQQFDAGRFECSGQVGACEALTSHRPRGAKKCMLLPPPLRARRSRGRQAFPIDRYASLLFCAAVRASRRR